MISSVQVFVAKSVATCSRGRTGVYSRDYACTQHDVGRVTVVQRCGETSDVGNHASTDHQDWFVSGDSDLLKGHKDTFHSANIFIDFISRKYQCLKLDPILVKVGLNCSTIEMMHFIIYDRHTPNSK